MKLLSASIIAKIEEVMIGDMIDSVKGCDEIMVVDTGSTDNTVKIAKEKGAKVFRGYKWNDNFAEARNVAKDKCSGEWLLIIDCDEIFEGSIDRLKELLVSPLMKEKDGIFFSVKTPQETNDQIRVFRNSPNIHWSGAAHNLPYVFDTGTPERIPDSRLFRSSFKIKANHSPSHQIDPDRTLRILTKELQKDPGNTRYLYYIAREWLNRGQVMNCIFFLERYCKIAPPTNELADAYYVMSTCYLDMGDIERAIECATKATTLLPSFKAPWVLMHNLSHPNYKKYWKAAADVADNKGALFVRELSERMG
jgi:glycosyltransferase involved in cell wall biosynthesis